MNRLRLLVVLAAATAFAACSPQAASEPSPGQSAGAENATPSVHPVSGLPVIPVTLSLDSGAHVITSELATTDQQRARGLMFRTELGADEGMLFDYEDDPHVLSFWMRNTVIPLDIIFIAPDRTVLNVAANTVPYSEESSLSDGIAIAVLELNGGRAAELGIAPGTPIDW